MTHGTFSAFSLPKLYSQDVRHMFNSIDRALAFDSKMLSLRGYRQQILASNIANADTPNYKAMDIDFSKVLSNAMGNLEMARTNAGHLNAKNAGPVAGVKPMYRTAVQPSIDGNTVDTDVEQAKFAENALQYMTTLQVMNGKIQSTLLAMRNS
jgi:flagellar basal-body rod protein FlgB